MNKDIYDDSTTSEDDQSLQTCLINNADDDIEFDPIADEFD